MKEELEREKERHAESKLKLATAEKVVSSHSITYPLRTSFSPSLFPPFLFLFLHLPGSESVHSHGLRVGGLPAVNAISRGRADQPGRSAAGGTEGQPDTAGDYAAAQEGPR